jgi:ATP-dependent Clp protease protease subunit
VSVPGWPTLPPPPEQPEFPYPYPPERPVPRRTEPVAVPVVDLPSGDTVDQLLARRRVLVTGPLDSDTVNRVAAELMALDGRSADDVEVLINSDGGPLTEVVTLLDVIGAMRARVATTCFGRARGTAAVLLACGTGKRQASPSALISLHLGGDQRVEGRSDEVRAQLDELDLARRHLLGALATATGKAEDELVALVDRGQVTDVEQARQLGIIDAAAG